MRHAEKDLRDSGEIPAVILVKSNDEGTYVRVNPKCTLPAWETWPEATDILCWNCCHSFSSRPIPLPTKYDEKKDTFHVMGNFCSWACVKAFSRDYGRSLSGRGLQAMTIALLRKRLTGALTPIVAAPPRVVLKAFGGYMDIDEYRRATECSTWMVPPPRLITQAQVIHDRKRSEQRASSHDKIIDLSSQIDMSSSSPPVSETLKLKRPKPPKKTSNMLEVALGLVSK